MITIPNSEVLKQVGDKLLTIDGYWFYIYSYNVQTDSYQVIPNSKVSIDQLEKKEVKENEATS